MTSRFEQLPLAIQLRDDATFDNYYAGDNSLLLAELRRQFEGGERYLYFFGNEGSGRTHLLQAACHHAEQLRLSSAYMPLRELNTYSPEALFEGLDQLALVCLDDIHCVVGDGEWERALFDLFNRLKQENVRLLVSADSAVRQLGGGFPNQRFKRIPAAGRHQAARQ